MSGQSKGICEKGRCRSGSNVQCGKKVPFHKVNLVKKMIEKPLFGTLNEFRWNFVFQENFL
jgi:hypothetical protein